MSNVNVILPSFYNNNFLNKFITDMFIASKDKFYDFTETISYMGAFPYFIWDKDNLNKNFISREDLIRELNFFKAKNTPIYLSCNNTKLNCNHFNDLYCNMVFDIALNESVSVYAIVYNIELAEYLKAKYKNIKIVFSEELKLSTPDFLPDYYITDFSLKNKSIIFDKKPSSSFIIKLNSYCKNDCTCSDNESQDKINFVLNKSFECNNYVKLFEESKKSDSFVNIETFFKLIKNGFTNFIITDNKQDKYELLESYLYYLIKPEYINEIRLMALKQGGGFFNSQR